MTKCISLNNIISSDIKRMVLHLSKDYLLFQSIYLYIALHFALTTDRF